MALKNNKEKFALPTFPLRGVGKQLVKHLARLNIHSISDLLFHLPARYQDRTHIQSIQTLVPDDEAVIDGIIQDVSRPQRGRTKLLCQMSDDTGTLYLRFFHVHSFQVGVLKPGTHLRCYGRVYLGVKGLEMIHPEFQVIVQDKQMPVDLHLTPIYPATEGLSQYTLRKLTANALAWMENESVLVEVIPAALLQSHSLPTLKAALHFVHRPPRETSMLQLLEHKTIAQKRLVFEELLAHRISLLNVKRAFQLQQAMPLQTSEQYSSRFISQLPFQLTAAQKRVANEIKMDLMQPHPMLRLLQGDVGSGKTVIAALAMLQAVANHHQAAMMAPTELLAEQHYRVFKKWFEPLNIEVVFLSGHIKGRERTAVLDAITNGQAQIILGTHALFQVDVHFSHLALVVIDEQHRFGVHQRALFREKGLQAAHHPHQLMMTATPIPRTLAMSFYADLDCSLLDELPPGRTPIVTSIVPNIKRVEVIVRIREACEKGRQVYWVCPLIEESEALSCQAATKTAEQLQLNLSELKIGLIHGRVRAEDKDAIMRRFQQGEIHVLVATTVIEVGVDVANASVMIIENAERLGLSQLHQLRGRVGRGNVASHCVLLYQHPLSDLAKERLAVIRETTDGFQIAESDLKLRGPGEVLGTRQAGALSFRVADLLRDSDLLPAIYQAAELMMKEYPQYIEPLLQRWLKTEKEYGKV